jgi:hypothetical protein
VIQAGIQDPAIRVIGCYQARNRANAMQSPEKSPVITAESRRDHSKITIDRGDAEYGSIRS